MADPVLRPQAPAGTPSASFRRFGSRGIPGLIVELNVAVCTYRPFALDAAKVQWDFRHVVHVVREEEDRVAALAEKLGFVRRRAKLEIDVVRLGQCVLERGGDGPGTVFGPPREHHRLAVVERLQREGPRTRRELVVLALVARDDVLEVQPGR